LTYHSILLIVLPQKAFGVMTTSSRRLLAISPQVFQLPVRLPTSFVRQLATVPQSGNVVPTKPATYAVFVELSHVKRKIIDIESSIQAIEATIQDVESQLNLCVESQLNVAQRLDDSDPKKAGEVQYLRAKETQLRAKETQLRAEKIQLRATVAELRKEAVLLRGKAEPQFQQNVRTFVLRFVTALHRF
jgi:hypothetical protein